MKIGILGCWGHYQTVLDEIDHMPGMEVGGLAPGVPGEDMAPLRKRYPQVLLYPEPDALLASGLFDLVIISTRLDRIPVLAVQAAAAGCHSICEKPLALDRETLRSLWDQVAANGTQCVAMLHNRTHPVLAAVRECIAAGEIGDVHLVNARKSYKCKDEPVWWLGRRATYGGTLPWVGIHALDFIAFVCGDPGFEAVAAFHANAAHPLQPEREDICTVNVRLRNGVLATASIDYLRPLSAATHGDDWLRVVGSRGSLEVEMEGGVLRLLNGQGVREHGDFPSPVSFYPDFLYRLRSRGRESPWEETRRSFALTHTALCARDAADQGMILTGLGGPWDADEAEVSLSRS